AGRWPAQRRRRPRPAPRLQMWIGSCSPLTRNSGKGDDAIGRFIARDAVSEKLYGADLMACSRRKARPAFTAMIAAGTVRAAPIRNGQSCPKAENSAPAAIGPAIR